MAYVDLNPVRAKMAETPENSEHTSIKKRAKAFNAGEAQPSGLAKFIGNPRNNMPQGLPFNFKDYLEIVDWTGRIQRTGKRGYIAETAPPILDRINMEPEEWLKAATVFESQFKSMAGCIYRLKHAAQKLGYKRTPSLSNCRTLFH